MDLLTQYAYPSISGYSKFTIQLSMKQSFDEIHFTLGPAIPLTFEDGEFIPKSNIYDQVYRLLFKYIERYDGDCILGITIIIFMLGGVKDKIPLLSEDAREKSLLECLQPVSGQIDLNNPISDLKIQHKKLNYPSHITGIKSSQRKRTRLKSFLVADTETILIDNVHKPYAAGVMMVIPGLDLKTQTIYTYFSEDYTPYVFKSFEERSQKLLNDFILRIISIIKQNPSIKTVYFHNFSRFDGLFVLKHLALHHKMFKLKPLMRDNRLYEVAVYSGKRMLFRLRDSLHLLPGKLDDLAKNLCPELGSKGSIPYDQVTLSNLSSLRESLVEYMKQDILLLGGIMHNFQDLYAKAYKADIENKITAASLALSLFRSNYYDEVQFPIHIPNKNEDTFIRRGYYGGHADAYTPYGENLYYYDINSLYPFVMKEFPMPGGVPVWHSDIDSMELDSMFGFIQAYVECPKTMKRPFLPYRNDKDGILLFPTGEFVGVYYSEELKYARDLGYKVLPICGYLFQKMESPFKDYVNSLFECRSNAKKQGNNAIGYVYKLLLNSLYGRFGINPISTITEMCDKNRRDFLLRTGTFINDASLREDLYMVSYHSNMEKGPDYWKPPKNSAIQLAAAITASARIYMYKYISREDCYYTDTDSIVLGNPLPEDLISSSVLGKFKLEDQIKKGYFLAPKCYLYTTEEDGNHHVMRFKGAAKSIINPEWFEQQYADPYRMILASVTSNFRINWSELEVIKKESPVTLRIALNRKRIAIIQDQKWLDTDPIEISDLSALSNIGIKIIRALRKKINQLETEKSLLLDEILSQKELEIADKKRIRESRELLETNDPK
ncbi:uncharacterized protein LOC113776793 [Coffea eugenioides]|uniref:uncharacterized protein LOC113776793 n=1 Tax=Coffea eugenioides TaxID=49369 RepID=UPI000F608F34|nr:uncharacterized protein LOC113776793 [Coffea eugenioides]